jgi:hypothetical protein
MQKIGRSGVELHEVRSSASLETEDGKSRARPISNYHSISKNTSTKGQLWSGAKLRSHGFGEGKCNKVFEGELSKEDKSILKLIAAGESVKKCDPDTIVWMEDQNLIYWNGVKWKLMQSGKARLASAK